MSEDSPHLFLDTNVIVRYLTADPLDVARAVSRIIESDRVLTLTTVVLVEAAYVLTKLYRRERDSVVAGLAALVQRSNVQLLGVAKSLVLEGLYLCRGSNCTSFHDALLWAEVRNLPGSRLLTLDQRFPSQGIEIERLGTEP